MRSDSLRTVVPTPGDGGAVRRLLDPAFGFFVWAAHFLVVYVTTAVGCVIGLGSRTARVRGGFILMLVAVTFVATLAVVIHGWRRYRQDGSAGDHGFAREIAVGEDAVAAAAILYQLFPILMVPLCT
jgi:hypothetical protein